MNWLILLILILIGTSKFCHSSTTVYVYLTKNSYTGNLGGRSGGDAICVSDIPSFSPFPSCTYQFAVIDILGENLVSGSITATNINFQPFAPVYGIPYVSSFTMQQIATSWTNFFNPGITTSLNAANMCSSQSLLWWTGFPNYFGNGNLGVSSGDPNCLSWSLTTSNIAGQGTCNAQGQNWFNPVNFNPCSLTFKVLCACVSVIPTHSPSVSPTHVPSHTPSTQPSHTPTTSHPTPPTRSPTKRPSFQPTYQRPSQAPSKNPSSTPSRNPTRSPSRNPTTTRPSRTPTTTRPTRSPSKTPTTNRPSLNPTALKTKSPTKVPTTEQPQIATTVVIGTMVGGALSTSFILGVIALCT